MDNSGPFAQFLVELFGATVANRAIPKYQFERRVDAILAIFLPELLSKSYGWEAEIVVPEFPIKKRENNQSRNVDYLLYRHGGEAAVGPAWVFFELKTDLGSVRDEQFEVYLAAMERGMTELQRELKVVAAASKAAAKYRELTARLAPYPPDAPIELVYLHPGRLERADYPPTVHLLSFCELQGIALERHAEAWDMFRGVVIPKLV